MEKRKSSPWLKILIGIFLIAVIVIVAMGTQGDWFKGSLIKERAESKNIAYSVVDKDSDELIVHLVADQPGIRIDTIILEIEAPAGLQSVHVDGQPKPFNYRSGDLIITINSDISSNYMNPTEIEIQSGDVMYFIKIADNNFYEKIVNIKYEISKPSDEMIVDLVAEEPAFISSITFKIDAPAGILSVSVEGENKPFNFIGNGLYIYAFEENISTDSGNPTQIEIHSGGIVNDMKITDAMMSFGIPTFR
jgi:hypothetical protein